MISKQWKRLAAGLLCAAMIVTSIPMEAFAAAPETSESAAAETNTDEESGSVQSGDNASTGETSDNTEQGDGSAAEQPSDTSEEGEQPTTEQPSEELPAVTPTEEVQTGFTLTRNSLAGAEAAGSFVLAAFSQNVAVIEPVTISYEAGDTVRDALADSSYTFAGLETGFIQSVEGVGGNYSMVFADGGYGLDTAADKVGTFFLSERTDVDITTDEALVLAVSEALKTMAAYNEAANNVQNYTPAATAYKTLLTDMRTGNAEKLTSDREALEEAVQAYAAYLESGKRTVTVHVTQGDTAVTDALLAFTDEYGNVTEATGNTIELRDGSYSFTVTDAKNPYNYTTNVGKVSDGTKSTWKVVENYFTVSETSTEVNVKLAAGEWFGEITAVANASDALCQDKTEYDEENHKIVFYVADKFTNNVRVTINKSSGTPEYATSGTKSSTPIYPWVDFVYVSGSDAGKRVSDVKTTSVNTNRVSFGSNRSCLNILDYGMEGNELECEIRWLDDAEEDATGYLVVQSYDITLKRFPTLSDLNVKDSAGSSLISDYSAFTYDYSITTTDSSFTVDTTAYDASYSVAVKAGENTTVTDNAVKLEGVSGTFTVEVTAGEVVNVYTVSLTKVDPAEVTLTMEEGVTAEVFNASGSKIAPVTTGGNTYALVPDATYTYVGTKETYYHTTEGFTATKGATVPVAAPEVKTVLTDFIIYDLNNKTTRVAYTWDKLFETDCYDYTVQIPDVKSGAVLYAQATSIDSSYEYYVSHLNQTTTEMYADTVQDWTAKKISYAVDTSKSGSTLGNRIVAASGKSNLLKMQLRKTSGTVTYYQEFNFELVRTLHLKDLSASTESVGELTFVDSDGKTLEFDRDTFEYIAKVSADTQSLNLSLTFPNEDSTYSFDGGYYALVNGTRYDTVEEIRDIELDLDVNKAEETVEIQVCHEDTKAIRNTYTITVKKQQPIKVTFDTDPENAIVYIVNQLDNKTIYSDDKGIFTLMPDVPYTYTASAPGYKTIQVTDFKLEEGLESKTVEVKLEKAPENAELKQLDAEWPSFRADDNNNGVVSAKTPIKDEDAVLYWATKVGDGYGSGATGCPILVGGYLYTYAGSSIVKVDTTSGEVVDSGEMAGSSSFAINSPTYANGMIFVALSGGRVQAFNADTLESLWLYTDSLGGQPNCSIQYSNGYIYTGFWNGEEGATNAQKRGNFVCISVTDEDPTQAQEAKLASWSYTHNGFYWAGAYAGEDFVLVGTDDGASGYTTGHASVLSFDPKTGKLIDEITLTGVGDLRCNILYDEKGTGDFYFDTKGGDFYRLSVNADGTFKNLMSLKLYNYTSDASNPAMSTSTPVIYNGRAYIGVSGTSQFTAYSGHNITVIDLESWSIAYSVRTQGYPQTSGLLTTAYEEETGLVYVYFFDNYTPGKLRIFSDKKGQTKPNEVTVESGYDTASILFTPTGEQAQYAICSPIADSNGFLYFKNDSARMMCVGPTMTKLEVTKQPTKTRYAAGSTFEAEGMQVTATYSNGTTKDVTDYISFSTDPLTTDDTEFIIEFPYTMYQDKDGKTGVDYTAPIATVTLEITVSVAAVETAIDEIGTVTLESEEAIVAARELYETLPEEEKEKVSNYEILTAAEAALEQWKKDKAAADVFAEKVSAIGSNPYNITLADEAAIEDAKATYMALNDNAKSYVNANYKTQYNFMGIAIQRLAQLKQNADNQAYADAVEAKIAAIGEVTLSSETAIEQARAAYDYLSDEQKALVSEASLNTLTAAENALKVLKDEVTEVETAINAIGDVTLGSEAAITAARTAYDALNTEQKAEITEETLKVLTDAEAKLAELKGEVTAVETAINAIGEVTLESEEVITAARTAYNSLDAEQKAAISDDTLKLLTDAEEALEQLKADKKAAEDVTAQIKAIGEVTLEKETTVVAARTAYDALNNNAKSQVTEETVKLLTDAEAKIAQLKQEATDKEVAEALETAIAAIGDVTLSDEAAIAAAREVYNKMTAEQKELVSEDALNTLTAAENKLKELKDQVAAVEKAITEIGTVTLNSEKAIQEARTAYDALDTEQKNAISDETLKLLTDAEEALAKLKKESSSSGSSSGSSSSGTSSSSSSGSSSSSSSGSSGSSSTVTAAAAKTGDSTNLWMPVLMLAGAAAGICVLVVYSRKRKKSEQ